MGAGRGSPAQLWQEAMQADVRGAPINERVAAEASMAAGASCVGAAQALLPGGVLAGAYGAEVMPDDEASRRDLLAYSRWLGTEAHTVD